jgi:hypothetical protein
VSIDAQPADADLTSAEQDQMLHLMIWLLVSVDHPHRKKFYKGLVSTAKSTGGVYLPSCSHTGWKNGGFPVDASLLTRLWRSINRTMNIRHDWENLNGAAVTEHELRDRAEREGYRLMKRGGRYYLKPLSGGAARFRCSAISHASAFLDTLNPPAPR